MQDWWQTAFPQGRQYLEIVDASGQNVRIAYGDRGQGTPIVLCHGIGSWGYNWRAVVDVMPPEQRLIVFDAKGYGFSDKPALPERSGHQIVELERILQGVCPGQPAVLVGESLGGLTSLALAQRRPELVQQLVLINIPIFPKNLPGWGMQLISAFPLEIVRLVDQLRLAKHFAPLVRELTTLGAREIVADPSRLSANSEGVYWATYPYINDPNAVTKYAEDLQIGLREIQNHLQGKPSLISEIQANLPQTQIPSLILWGDCDRWFPVTDGYELQRRLPRSRLEILANCGHQASGDQPRQIAQLVLDFLAAFSVESVAS